MISHRYCLMTRGEKLIIGYDKRTEPIFSRPHHPRGKPIFKIEFAAKHSAPRLSGNRKMNLSIGVGCELDRIICG